MSALNDVLQKLQSGILEFAPSTVNVVENVTRIITELPGVTIFVDASELTPDLVSEDYRNAGLIGEVHFNSMVSGCIKEDVDAYRNILQAVPNGRGEVWAGPIEGIPKGYLATGLRLGMRIYDTHSSMSKEALITEYIIFVNTAHDYAEFVRNSLRFKEFS